MGVPRGMLGAREESRRLMSWSIDLVSKVEVYRDGICG